MKPSGGRDSTEKKELERIRYTCVKCGKKFPHAPIFFCDQCGGFIDVDYDLSMVNIVDSENPLEKYFWLANGQYHLTTRGLVTPRTSF